MNLKRILSLFLAFVLLLGMCPMAYAADADPTVGTEKVRQCLQHNVLIRQYSQFTGDELHPLVYSDN